MCIPVMDEDPHRLSNLNRKWDRGSNKHVWLVAGFGAPIRTAGPNQEQEVDRVSRLARSISYIDRPAIQADPRQDPTQLIQAARQQEPS